MSTQLAAMSGRRAAVLLVALAVLIVGGLSSSIRSGIPPIDSLLASPAQALPRLRTLLDRLRGRQLPDGIVKANGRIEATQIDVAAKYAGRLAVVTVNEGDDVTAGQVVARISAPEYEAQLRRAQAEVLRAKKALAESEAQIAQRKSDQAFAQAELERGESLANQGHLSRQALDQRRNKSEAADAALRAADAQREQAAFAIKSAEAEVDRIEAILVDLELIAPRSGRVQYRLARTGEVVGAGTRVLTILDLNDVYMTIFLPAAQAGPLILGDEARIIVDPLPQYVVPATVGFVAADAQFTPKSVETADEREKLMFRVKLQINSDVLTQHYRRVKTGVRGVGFVRTSAKLEWPADLQVKLPQ
jgi:HlyD family secretion protein